MGHTVARGGSVKRHGWWALAGLPAAVVALSLLLPSAGAAAQWQVLVTNDVTDSNSVSVIGAETNALETNFGVGAEPAGIAITPDGRTAFVADVQADALSRVSLAGELPETVEEIPLPAQPQELAVSPDGRAVWIVYSQSGELAKLDLSTTPATLGEPFSAGTAGQALDIAVSPDGKTGYVTDSTGDQVVPVDLATGEHGTPIKVGAEPYGIAVSPDGSRLFVCDAAGDELSIVELDHGGNVIGVPLGAKPRNDLAVSPDGSIVYVAAGSEVVPVQTATGAALAHIPVSFSSDPEHEVIFPVGITPDGSKLFVGDGFFGGGFGPWGEQVVAIPVDDGTQDGEATTIQAQDEPWGVAITPDQAPVAAFSDSGGTAGSPVSFDASPSTVEFGSIARYEWDFGDGSAPVVTAVPRVSHSYAAAGSYTAAVTETDSAGTSTAQVYNGQTMVREGGPSARATGAVAVAPAAPPGSSPVTPAPTPVLGRALTVSGVSGTVRVRLPGGHAFQPLATSIDIPVGSEVDATGASVTFRVARPNGATATVTVAGGRFRITQTAAGVTTFTLTLPLTGCPTARRAGRASAARRRRHGPTKRHITVSENSGGFDTKGQYVATSVEGTVWTTADACTSSTVSVAKGRVRVTDLVRHRAVTLKTGQTYTAHAHR